MVDWKVEFCVEKMPKLKNPLLIEGLPGIANVGKIAVDFLVQEIKAKKLASFFSYKFPHSVFVNEKNLVEMPKIELFYKKNKSPKRDLLILTGDVQPIDEESCYSFCEKVLEIVKGFGCKEVVTTGGIGLSHLPDKPKVYATANDEKFLKSFAVKKLKVDTKIFGVVGPIIGVSGVFLGVGAKMKMKGAALLAETFGHQMYLGVKGATEILRVLNTKYKLNIKVKKMDKEILELEKEVLAKTKEWLSEAQQHGNVQAGGKLRKKEQSYIG